MHDYQTRTTLPSDTKTVSIAILNARLADAIDLALLTKQARWDIKGAHFIALHEMIDGFRSELDTHVDTIAERIVQLGGIALGTTQAVAAATTPRFALRRRRAIRAWSRRRDGWRRLSHPAVGISALIDEDYCGDS
jgi:DNA-binding ferritin-like protein